jgi:hypothetical protein
MSGLVNYPFQLEGGRFATLFLPSDLTAADVRRIVAMLRALVPDTDVKITDVTIFGSTSLDVIATTGCKTSTETRKP